MDKLTPQTVYVPVKEDTDRSFCYWSDDACEWKSSKSLKELPEQYTFSKTKLIEAFRNVFGAGELYGLDEYNREPDFNEYIKQLLP